MIVEAIESDGVFWFKNGVEFLMGEKIVENNVGSLIQRFGGNEGRKIFFETERVEVVVEIERLGNGSGLKSCLELMVDLGGSIGARENKGRENREADGKGKKRFVETIDGGPVFRGHGIILTFGI